MGSLQAHHRHSSMLTRRRKTTNLRLTSQLDDVVTVSTEWMDAWRTPKQWIPPEELELDEEEEEEMMDETEEEEEEEEDETVDNEEDEGVDEEEEEEEDSSAEAPSFQRCPQPAALQFSGKVARSQMLPFSLGISAQQSPISTP